MRDGCKYLRDLKKGAAGYLTLCLISPHATLGGLIKQGRGFRSVHLSTLLRVPPLI